MNVFILSCIHILLSLANTHTHSAHEKMDAMIQIEGEGLQLHPPERVGDEKTGKAKHVMRHLGLRFNATASLEESVNVSASTALRNTRGMSIFDAWKELDGCDYETTTRT